MYQNRYQPQQSADPFSDYQNAQSVNSIYSMFNGGQGFMPSTASMLGGGQSAAPVVGMEWAGAPAGSSAGGGMAGLFSNPYMLIPALVMGAKLTEAKNPGTPYGDASLGLAGPSFAQIKEDPVGMGLPTLLGAPFLTPFTGSDKAKGTSPEWSGLVGK